MVKNLNENEFTKDDISYSYYYSKFGSKTINLKTEIEEALINRFNERSDILDGIDWNTRDLEEYIFYSMLKRKFEYLTPFEDLGVSSFGENQEAKYFGLKANTNSDARKYIKVIYDGFLFGEEGFALCISTKEGDEIILYKNPEGSSFKAIYDNLIEKETKFKRFSGTLDSDVILEIPYVAFNVLKDFTELKNRAFLTNNGTAVINEAIQSISIHLDKFGGEIKSDASLVTSRGLRAAFCIDDTFAIFLKERDKSIPYFAARIENINKVQ